MKKKEQRPYLVIMAKAQHGKLKELSKHSGHSMNTLIVFGIERIVKELDRKEVKDEDT